MWGCGPGSSGVFGCVLIDGKKKTITTTNFVPETKVGDVDYLAAFDDDDDDSNAEDGAAEGIGATRMQSRYHSDNIISMSS